MAAFILRGHNGCATLRDLYRACMVSHVSVTFFFVLFSLEKSSVEDGTGRNLTDFLTFKTGVVQPLLHYLL